MLPPCRRALQNATLPVSIFNERQGRYRRLLNARATYMRDPKAVRAQHAAAAAGEGEELRDADEEEEEVDEDDELEEEDMEEVRVGAAAGSRARESLTPGACNSDTHRTAKTRSWQPLTTPATPR